MITIGTWHGCRGVYSTKICGVRIHTRIEKFENFCSRQTVMLQNLVAARGCSRIVAIQLTLLRQAQSFSTSLAAFNAAADKKDQQKEVKKKLKRAQLVKARNKQAPEVHPLYMEVPRAMRYLRAAEVGNPASRTTVSVQVTVIPEKGSKPLSGSVFFPKPIKENSVIVFSLDEHVLEGARKLGAKAAGGQELIESIRSGEFKLDGFTQCYATPDVVKDLKPIARTLGPKGLMPTPKRNTVSENIIQLIQENLGALPFKQRGQHLSMPVGRCDFSDAEIVSNLKAASEAVYATQPPGTKKPNLIGQAVLGSTMGPSVVINFKP